MPEIKEITLIYARQDEVAARERRRVLSQAPGVNVFIDVLSLRDGEEWEERIRQRLHASDRVILLWSEHAKKSRRVKAEWKESLALRATKGEGFLVIDSLDSTPVPRELKPIHRTSSPKQRVRLTIEKEFTAWSRDDELRARLGLATVFGISADDVQIELVGPGSVIIDAILPKDIAVQLSQIFRWSSASLKIAGNISAIVLVPPMASGYGVAPDLPSILAGPSDSKEIYSLISQIARVIRVEAIRTLRRQPSFMLGEMNADDLVNEVLRQLFEDGGRDLLRFDPAQGNLKTYISAYAMLRLRNLERNENKRRAKSREIKAAQDDTALAWESSSVDEQIIAKETIGQIRAALALRFPSEMEQLMLRLVFDLGLSAEEIEREHHIPSPEAHQWRFRILKAAREISQKLQAKLRQG